MAGKTVLREVKTFRLGQLIEEHPDYSYTRLNKLLVDEFGSGLRKKYVLELVRSVRAIKPTQVEVRGLPATGIQQTIYWKWRRAGFVQEEAKELALGHGGVKVNCQAVYNSAPAQLVRIDRRKLIKGLLKKGWTKAEIAKEIRAHYTKDKKRSPWDFIKALYRPPQKAELTAYKKAVQARAKSQARELYRAHRARRQK